MNNKDKNDEVSYENIDNNTHAHIQTPKVDCKYSKNGLCDECTLMEDEFCPYVDESK